MDGLERIIEELESADIRCDLWVDGSFLTQKIDPEDADMVLMVDKVYADLLEPWRKDVLVWYADEERHTSERCHTFYHGVVAGSAASDDTVEYWKRWFGNSRSSEHKGIVVVEIGRN